MTRIAHLSDLHFGGHDPLQPRIHEGLLTALSRQPNIDALIITGDVFDTSEPAEPLIDAFVTFFDQLHAALGHELPSVLLPGNHDRRHSGVFAPWSDSLFKTLWARLASRNVVVAGTRTPRLAEWVELPGVDADIVAYDSTWLPRGLASAGGVIRQADLLELGARLTARDRPLLFLVHHHLVPTPVTDTLLIDTRHRPVFEQFAVSQLLPDLVANGDREELTMTAMGAGTALTTLQQLGRAVLVLHGHKHYPTVRALSGIEAAEGDVLISSAGSCGLAARLSGSDLEEAPRLWPSFNVVDLSPRELSVRMVTWSPWEEGRVNPPRELVRAAREAHRWLVRRHPPTPVPFEPVLSLNEAHYQLRRSEAFLERYDVEVTRTVRALPAAYMKAHWDVIEGAPGACVVNVRFDGASQEDLPTPTQLAVPMERLVTYRVQGAAVSTLDEAKKAYGPEVAYEWVGLINRSRAAKVEVKVDLGPVAAEPFASVLDLTTGKERPWPLRRHGQLVQVSYDACPARTLVRVHWALS